jgi:hypothetical protein
MVGKSSLIFVVGFGIIMGYIVTNLVSMGTRATENVSWYNAATSSKNLATIGINVGLARLHENPNLPFGTVVSQEIDTGPYSGGRFDVYYDQNPNDPTTRILRSVSTNPITNFNTITDEIVVEFLPVGENEFRMFAWIANFNGNPRFFYGQDIVWGPLHSNGGLHMRRSQNDPRGSDDIIFHGKVTTNANVTPTNPPGTYFLGQFSQKQDEIPVPETIGPIRTQSQVTYTEDIFVEFRGDEVAIWKTDGIPDTQTEAPHDTYSISSFISNLGIFTTGNVKVQGTVSGKVAIGSDNDITIVNDVIYATNPPYEVIEMGIVDGKMREEHFSNNYNDLLGLYAENNIIIGDKGGEDITIHGILLALESINFENHSTRQLAKIETWGSLMMGNRGDMNPSPGVIQRYRYDTRLDDNTFRPPHFPGTETTGLVIISWYESVQLPPF